MHEASSKETFRTGVVRCVFDSGGVKDIILRPYKASSVTVVFNESASIAKDRGDL